MESSQNRTLHTEQKKSQKESELTENSSFLFSRELPKVVQNSIFEFLDNNVGTKKFKASGKVIKHAEENKNNCSFPENVTFFGNATVLYYDKLTADIAHNLLFHKKIEETLALLQRPENQKCLYTTVEISDPHGCNLLLLVMDGELSIEQSILDRAKNTETPILIRNDDKFFIYGSKKGDEDWGLTEMKGQNAVLKGLPFDDQDIFIFQRSHDLFTNDLIEILKKGHAHIYGQRVRNNLVGILSSAGDRNIGNRTDEEKPHGLVERLRFCFQKSEDFDSQRAAWEKNAKAATEVTMAPYRQAIETLCQELIESKEIPNTDWDEITDDEFEELVLNLPIAQKFRKALQPNPDYVVRGGFLFDVQIFQDFIDIFNRNVGKDRAEANTLGGSSSLKSDLFDAIVYPALQFRCQRCDHMIFKTGLSEVFVYELNPDAVDYFEMLTPEDLAGFGTSHYFSPSGNRCWVPEQHADSSPLRGPAAGLFFQKLISSKNISLSPWPESSILDIKDHYNNLIGGVQNRSS